MGEILDDLSYFSSLYPRLEGAQGEKAAYFYLQRRLEEEKIPYTSRSLDQLRGAHSFSSSLEVLLPGKIGDTLTVVIPIDHPAGVEAENDGAVNLALGLALIREFAPRERPIGLRFLFLGAEYSGDENRQIGTREFLADYFPAESQAFLYLDFKRPGARINVRSGGEGVVAPYWFTQRMIDSLEFSGLDYRYKDNENQIHRLRMWHKATRIDPYLQAGYPGITLSGDPLEGDEASVRWISSLFSLFFRILEENQDGFLEQWDRHYLYFMVLGNPVSISEQNYLYLLLGIIVLPLSYPFFMSLRFLRYLRTLLKNFWDVPVLLLLIFLFLTAGTYGLRGLLLLRDFPALWRELPFIAFLIKGGLALTIFFLFFGLIRRLPFSQNSSFYSSSALFLLMAAVLFIGLIDISMTYSLLWAFAWAFLFTVVPSRIGKGGALLISTLLVAKSFYDVFTERAFEVIEFLLIEPFMGNLFLAIIVLPFLLMLIRLDFLVRHPTLMQQKVILRNAGILTGALSLIAILFLFGYQAYPDTGDQPLEILERIEAGSGERLVRISSPAPIEALLLSGPGSPGGIVIGRREYEYRNQTGAELLKTDLRTETFLDRERFLLEFSADEALSSLELTFSGSDEFLVYDVNFPVTYNAATKEARIHIGRNPELPLKVDAVFPAGTAERLLISAEFSGTSADITPMGREYRIRAIRYYTQEIDLLN